MIEGKLTCPDALSTLIFFNGWLGFESLETDDDSPSKDELLGRRLVVMKILYTATSPESWLICKHFYRLHLAGHPTVFINILAVTRAFGTSFELITIQTVDT